MEPESRLTRNPAPVRTFATGANRDTDDGKFDYEGFLSPVVLERFAQYMHEHRKLRDGSYRDSDNWQKGIPPEQCLKSLLRHVMTVWKAWRVEGTWRQEELCAILFNAAAILLDDLGGTRPEPQAPATIERRPDPPEFHPDPEPIGEDDEFSGVIVVPWSKFGLAPRAEG